MKKILPFLLLFIMVLCCSSCHKKQLQEKPADLIAYPQMIDIITDIYMIEGISFYTPYDSARTEKVLGLYQWLFEEHNITKEQLHTSFGYYLADEDQAKQMLQEASDRVEVRAEKYGIERKQEEIQQ